MSVFEKPVEDGIAEGGVADDVVAVVGGDLAGVAIIEHLEEVVPSLAGPWLDVTSTKGWLEASRITTMTMASRSFPVPGPTPGFSDPRSRRTRAPTTSRPRCGRHVLEFVIGMKWNHSSAWAGISMRPAPRALPVFAEVRCQDEHCIRTAVITF